MASFNYDFGTFENYYELKSLFEVERLMVPKCKELRKSLMDKREVIANYLKRRGGGKVSLFLRFYEINFIFEFIWQITFELASL